MMDGGRLLALNQYQESWIQYRTTCESLRQHKYRFLTGAEPYSDAEGAFGRLVENVEALLSKENAVWGEHIKAGSNEPASA